MMMASGPANEQAEARRGQPAAEGEGADGQREGQDGADDEDRPAQAPALQGIAVLDEGEDQKGEAGQADADGEPARQHGRAHGVERALVEIPGEPERQGGKGDEENPARQALRGTDRTAMARRLGAFVENRHGRPPGERIPRPRLLRPIWPEAAALDQASLSSKGRLLNKTSSNDRTPGKEVY